MSDLFELQSGTIANSNNCKTGFKDAREHDNENVKIDGYQSNSLVLTFSSSQNQKSQPQLDDYYQVASYNNQLHYSKKVSQEQAMQGLIVDKNKIKQKQDLVIPSECSPISPSRFLNENSWGMEAKTQKVIEVGKAPRTQQYFNFQNHNAVQAQTNMKYQRRESSNSPNIQFSYIGAAQDRIHQLNRTSSDHQYFEANDLYLKQSQPNNSLERLGGTNNLTNLSYNNYQRTSGHFSSSPKLIPQIQNENPQYQVNLSKNPTQSCCKCRCSQTGNKYFPSNEGPSNYNFPKSTASIIDRQQQSIKQDINFSYQRQNHHFQTKQKRIQSINQSSQLLVSSQSNEEYQSMFNIIDFEQDRIFVNNQTQAQVRENTSHEQQFLMMGDQQHAKKGQRNQADLKHSRQFSHLKSSPLYVPLQQVEDQESLNELIVKTINSEQPQVLYGISLMDQYQKDFLHQNEQKNHRGQYQGLNLAAPQQLNITTLFNHKPSQEEKQMSLDSFSPLLPFSYSLLPNLTVPNNMVENMNQEKQLVTSKSTIDRTEIHQQRPQIKKKQFIKATNSSPQQPILDYIDIGLSKHQEQMQNQVQGGAELTEVPHFDFTIQQQSCRPPQPQFMEKEQMKGDHFNKIQLRKSPRLIADTSKPPQYQQNLKLVQQNSEPNKVQKLTNKRKAPISQLDGNQIKRRKTTDLQSFTEFQQESSEFDQSAAHASTSIVSLIKNPSVSSAFNRQVQSQDLQNQKIRNVVVDQPPNINMAKILSLSNPDPAQLFDCQNSYISQQKVPAKNSPKKISKQEENKVDIYSLDECVEDSNLKGCSEQDTLLLKRTKKSFRKLQIPQEFNQRQDVVLKTILRMIRRYFVNKFNAQTNYIKAKRGKDGLFYLERVRYFIECLAQIKHPVIREIFKQGGDNLILELVEFFGAMLYPRDIERIAEPMDDLHIDADQNSAMEIDQKPLSDDLLPKVASLKQVEEKRDSNLEKILLLAQAKVQLIYKVLYSFSNSGLHELFITSRAFRTLLKISLIKRKEIFNINAEECAKQAKRPTKNQSIEEGTEIYGGHNPLDNIDQQSEDINNLDFSEELKSKTKKPTSPINSKNTSRRGNKHGAAGNEPKKRATTQEDLSQGLGFLQKLSMHYQDKIV